MLKGASRACLLADLKSLSFEYLLEISLSVLKKSILSLSFFFSSIKVTMTVAIWERLKSPETSETSLVFNIQQQRQLVLANGLGAELLNFLSLDRGQHSYLPPKGQ